MRSFLLVSLMIASLSLGLVTKQPADTIAAPAGDRPSIQSPTRVDTSHNFLKSLSASNGTSSTRTRKRQVTNSGLQNVQNVQLEDIRPTPQPTGPSSRITTVHIQDPFNFAILLPRLGSNRGSIGSRNWARFISVIRNDR
jgi:hypothetical protein